MLGRGVLADAVAEIEHMPIATARRRGVEALEHRRDLAADRRRPGEQNVRIEVALQRDARADALSPLAELNRPVDADDIDAERGQRFEPGPAALGEDDV